MAHHTGDSFMDRWLNKLMRCDKSRLNCGVSAPHLSLQASGPWSESSVEVFYIDQSFSTKEHQHVVPAVAPCATIRGTGSVERDPESSTQKLS